MVKILLPNEFSEAEAKLRKIGLGALPDQGLKLMNKWVEDAVKEATPIFIDAIRNMSFSDARKILMSHDSSVTKYLRKSNKRFIICRVLPCDGAIFEKWAQTLLPTAMVSVNNKFACKKKVNPNIKDYVTVNQALNGVFKMIKIEENKIRTNLGERTSDLLKRVLPCKTISEVNYF